MYFALNLFVLFADLNTKNMTCPPLMISKTIREQSNNYSNNFKSVHVTIKSLLNHSLGLRILHNASQVPEFLHSYCSAFQSEIV